MKFFENQRKLSHKPNDSIPRRRNNLPTIEIRQVNIITVIGTILPTEKLLYFFGKCIVAYFPAGVA